MRHLPPLNSLKAFESVARLGGALRAAGELCVSHGAISKQVAVLEKWLGVPVFDRHAHGMKVNRDGLELLREVQPALDRMALAVGKITADRGVEKLVVSAPPTMTMHWLLPRLPSFMAEHPSIRIQLNNRRDRGVGLPEGVDVVIRRGDSTDPSLTQQRFMSEAISPVCTPAVLRDARIRGLADLASMTWLTADMRPRDWPDWLDFAEAGPLSAPRQLSFDHSYLALQAARDGLGVAMGSLYLIQEDLASKTLVPIFPGLVLPSQPYVMAYRAGKRHEATVASFEAWLTTAGRDHERATRRALRALIKL
ncbi:MAG: bacterial regulatory helix-turn-helix, lysR family protein [Ramlibacter sp.]|nr:bacterial regulatory helix-turn-helix, lysR family protein [Ramlibacter sp.]